jgi:hypothetical protein
MKTVAFEYKMCGVVIQYSLYASSEQKSEELGTPLQI